MTRLTAYALCLLLLTATLGRAAVPGAACRGLGDWSGSCLRTHETPGRRVRSYTSCSANNTALTPPMTFSVIVLKHVYVAPSVSKAMLRLIVENVCMQNSAWNK